MNITITIVIIIIIMWPQFVWRCLLMFALSYYLCERLPFVVVFAAAACHPREISGGGYETKIYTPPPINVYSVYLT